MNDEETHEHQGWIDWLLEEVLGAGGAWDREEWNDPDGPYGCDDG